MKKLFISLVVIIVLAISVYFIAPGVLFSFPLGQKIVLRVEGDRPAIFYYPNKEFIGDTLHMEGVIYTNTYKDLSKAIAENPDLTTLTMVKVPGSVDDITNIKASLLLRKHNINTYIPEDGWVSSGGTDMFLAGNNRSAHSSARIGVHSWSDGRHDALDFPRDHQEHKIYLDYYKEIDIPQPFYWYTLELATPDEMHWMTEDEMALYNVTSYTFNSQYILRIQKQLASDKFAGRRSGENELAQLLIDSCFNQLGLKKFNASYNQDFTFTSRRNPEPIMAANYIAYLEGSIYPQEYIVVGAHYDHVGVRNNQVYNGADDNASGTAALFALAEYFIANPPEHSIIFAAFDAEEMGLRGSRYFVENPPVDKDDIILNINMDMISYNPDDELYVVGTHYYPEYKKYIDPLISQCPLNVYYGHDDPDNRELDYWMNSSDNGPFFRKGIPNITFSVEDHPYYHRPGDDFEISNHGFYLKTIDFIIKVLASIDTKLKVTGE